MSHYQNWTNMTPSPVQRGTLRTSWGLPSGINISFFRKAISNAYACYELVDFSVQCQLSVPAEKCVYWTFFCTLSSFSWAQKGHIYIPTKKGVFFSLYWVLLQGRLQTNRYETLHFGRTNSLAVYLVSASWSSWRLLITSFRKHQYCHLLFP